METSDATTSDKHIKLYIPGPVEVSPATFEAMAAPMIGHRSREFQELYADIQPGLRQLCETTQPVFLSTSSAWGVMEGCIRNLVRKKVLNCCCGAFSDKWFDVSQRCGKEAEALRFDWGRPVDPAALDEKLAQGGFDTVTFVHNETSTGVMSSLADVAGVVRKHPDVCLVVDTVSSFSVVPTPVDELQIDVLLTGSQKALALPPGLAIFTVSEKAMERASGQTDRGYYFDFHEFRKNHDKNMTPSTPCISLIHALRARVRAILEEGITERHQRHADLNALVHGWVKKNGFEFFAPEGYRSKSLTCVANNRGIDTAELITILRRDHDMTIDGGYGKVKGKTFRISNMGDETEQSMQTVLAALDDSLAKL